MLFKAKQSIAIYYLQDNIHKISQSQSGIRMRQPHPLAHRILRTQHSRRLN